jgi:hypothetical protein
MLLLLRLLYCCRKKLLKKLTPLTEPLLGRAEHAHERTALKKLNLLCC